MAYLYLILSGILFGGIVFGGKILMNMGASLFEVMLYPEILSLLVILYPARRDFKRFLKIPLKIIFLLMFSMLMINLGEFMPIILNIPVSLIVLILYLQPLWTILIEQFYFHKKQPKIDWILVAIMLIGMIILVNPFNDKQFSTPGIISSFLGGLGLSLWVFITRHLRLQGISIYGTFLATNIFSILPILFLFSLAELTYQNLTLRILSFDLPPLLCDAFIFYSMIIFTLPNLLLYKASVSISATTVGVVLLLEPVTAVILDVLFFKSPLTLNIILGGLLILGANIYLILEKKSQVH